MTSNMRVELLKRNNSELQHRVTELKEQVEELEPLEEENNELRDENNHYKTKMQDMEDEMAQLKDENDNLRKSNEEMLAINVECSSHWEDQEFAVQEAADTIIALETEKAALAVEVQKLKERVSALEDDSSRAGTLMDGSPRCPSLAYSIDDSRPSTSHFDSDYYSQPDSPQIKNSRESVISITPSERSQKFLDSTQERRRSARDLANRMSVASLKALRIASPSPAPSVPQIPEQYQQQIPRIVEQVATDRRSSRTPKRYRERQLPQQTLLDAMEMSPNNSPVGSEAATPRSLTHRTTRPPNGRSPNDSRPSSSGVKTPTTTTRPRSRQPSGTDISPHVPSRRSSKYAQTSNSSEHLSTRDHPSHRDLRNPQQRRQSEPNIDAEDNPQVGSEEWASVPPPVPIRSSLVSISDLTSEVDPSDPDRWWRSIDRLNQPATSQQPRPAIEFNAARPTEAHQPQDSPTLTRSKSHAQTLPDTPARPGISARSATRSDARTARTQPSTPAAEASYNMGKDLFNGSVDVETFLRKSKRMDGSAGQR